MARQKEGKNEIHPLLPSGDWEGFFTYQQWSHHKGQMQCQLIFREGRIGGSGTDEVGYFTWQGHYELDRFTCAMEKTYPASHSVHYSGRIDENGIWGTWSMGADWTGGFHIWPKKQAAAQTQAKAIKHSKKLQKA